MLFQGIWEMRGWFFRDVECEQICLKECPYRVIFHQVFVPPTGGIFAAFRRWIRGSASAIIVSKEQEVISVDLKDSLQLLRKKNGYSQEELADKIGIARQTISKWENGQAVPELNGLLLLSGLYGVTIDRIVKGNEECNLSLYPCGEDDIGEMIDFLLFAKRNTYAAKDNQTKASRKNSHDYCYEDENGYAYYDTYLGGECFAGEEAVWHHGTPVWSMNYAGRVIGEDFSGDFLKEALLHVPADKPFRGPEIYTKGDYHYHCSVTGEFGWFQGYEEIFYRERKIYECFFHGSILR